MEPVDPEKDGVPHYKKIITNPMDLGTVLNRLYLDYYKSTPPFWNDLGLVFKNCRKFNRDKETDIRILCDTLREGAIELYKQWHALMSERYARLKEENMERERNPEEETDLDKARNENRIDVKEEIKRNTELELKKKEQELINAIKNYEATQQQPGANGLQPNAGTTNSQISPAVSTLVGGVEANNASGFQSQLSLADSVGTLDSDRIKNQVMQIINSNPLLAGIKPINVNEILKQFEGNTVNANLLKSVNTSEVVKKEEAPSEQKIKEEPAANSTAGSQEGGPQQQQQKVAQASTGSWPPVNMSFFASGQEKVEGGTNSSAVNTVVAKKRVDSKSNIKGPTTYLTPEEIEMFNPGVLSFDWIADEKGYSEGTQEEYIYIGEPELAMLDINREVDKLYMVKWKNLSYLESTWEHESMIPSSHKINDFKMFNRALDKESRNQLLTQVNRHKTLLDIMVNPKKKAKVTNGYVQDLKNKLYKYDMKSNKQPLRYTPQTQPIYKERKLLRDYQLESLNWLIQAWYGKRNVILADEMGLGKTIQSISFLNHLINFENTRGPFLVIAPLSTLEHWKRTVEDWTNLNSVLYYDINGQDGRACCRSFEWFYIDISTKGTVLQSHELYKFHIMITSYEVFLQDLNNILINVPFQYIVVDEAHRLKNANAKILQALKRLPCKRILLLTGTPIQNNTDELWSLLNYIESEKFSRIETFKEEFGDLSSSEQIDKLHKMLKPFLLRRMKEDVESSIPPLQETIIDIELTTIQKTIYRALYERNKNILSKSFSGGNFTTSLNNLEMQLRKCCNHPFLIKDIEYEFLKSVDTFEDKFLKLIECSGKMILLDKLLPKFKTEGKKVLIFSQFTHMLSLLEDYLRYRGYKYEKIDGTIKSKERQSAIDRFNNPDKKRDVFILSTKAGGLGINLTSANVVIIYDSDWNPQNDVQATARAHRIGQVNEVQVYRLITAKTYESEMFERATKKLGLDQAIFMGGAFQSTGLTTDKDGALITDGPEVSAKCFGLNEMF
jgi:SNF2 family DNA or RNA helicase